ncbi:hypothetical protein HK104_005322 [Borealophlyctis nickersoniae]|nr:hypothetical protein HK104_005322 [Borealophlyctis nickersoniae]
MRKMCGLGVGWGVEEDGRGGYLSGGHTLAIQTAISGQEYSLFKLDEFQALEMKLGDGPAVRQLNTEAVFPQQKSDLAYPDGPSKTPSLLARIPGLVRTVSAVSDATSNATNPGSKNRRRRRGGGKNKKEAQEKSAGGTEPQSAVAELPAACAARQAPSIPPESAVRTIPNPATDQPMDVDLPISLKRPREQTDPVHTPAPKRRRSSTSEPHHALPAPISFPDLTSPKPKTEIRPADMDYIAAQSAMNACRMQLSRMHHRIGIAKTMRDVFKRGTRERFSRWDYQILEQTYEFEPTSRDGIQKEVLTLAKSFTSHHPLITSRHMVESAYLSAQTPTPFPLLTSIYRAASDAHRLHSIPMLKVLEVLNEELEVAYEEIWSGGEKGKRVDGAVVAEIEDGRRPSEIVQM